MGIDIEVNFIKRFVKKDFQTKFLSALKNEQKRRELFMCFSHNAMSYLKPNQAVLSESKIGKEECFSAIRRLTKENEWYYLDCDVIKAEKISLAEALERSYNQYGFSLCLSESVVFIKEETEKGAPQKYILSF